MRVLHIIPSVAEVRGGTSRAVIEMVQAQRALHIEATIATTDDNGANVLDVPLAQCIEYCGVPTYFFSRFSPSIAPLREFAFSSQLTAWLWHNIHKYDLLHVHALFGYPSTVAMLLARLRGVPYVVTPHGMLCTWSLQQSPLKKYIYLKSIELANLNGAQAIHFTAQQEYDEATGLALKSPATVIPLGLSIAQVIPDARIQLHKQLNIPLDEPVILFMSRLHPKKGLAELIPALGRLLEYRFTFVIAGSGDPDYEETIQQMLIASGIDTRTQRVGFVQGDMKQMLLQGADLLALTSHSENFGVVVLEALAGGTPVLLTPGVALASMVKRNCLGYVAELDVAEIAATLMQFLNHREEATIMGNRARLLIREQYGWDKITANMVEFYAAAIQHKRQPDLQSRVAS